jgi:trans-aconitate 2-methyltransferase
MRRDGWSPEDYAHFADARRKPFFDLLSLVEPVDSPRVLDVGCGSGLLTAEAHRLLGAASTVGLDASPAMLGSASPAGVELRQGSIPQDLPPGPFDVVVSNSALNWVDDHPKVFAALTAALAPRGQLAVQMPSNPDSAFSRCCQATAQAFTSELGGFVYRSPVDTPEHYAALLERLGFERQRIGTWHYPQRHPDVAGVVAFARGGLLSPYRQRLSPERFEAFVAEYEAALRRELGAGPVFFAFRRVFVFGRR